MNGLFKCLVGVFVLMCLFTGCGPKTQQDSNPDPGQEVTIEMTGDSQIEAFMPDRDNPPQVQMVLDGHQGDVTCLAFTTDGRYLVSASYGDYSLRIWDTADGQELSNVRTRNRVRSLAITPDGRTIITADAYHRLTWWTFENGIIGVPVIAAVKAGDALAISPDGKIIATTGYNLPVRLWYTGFPEPFKTLENSEHHRVLTFSPSGEHLAGGGHGNRISIWKSNSWKEKKYTISKIAKDSDVSSITVSPDGKYLATGHNDSSIVIFDLEDREERHNFFVHNASTRALVFSPDSKRLVTAQQNKRIYIWDSKTAGGLAQLSYHSQPVVSLAFAPEGDLLATGGEDRKIVFWGSGISAQPSLDTPVTGGSETTPAKAPPFQPEIVEGKRNFISAPNASDVSPYWLTEGETAIETADQDNPVFVIRYGGMIRQDIVIGNAVGRYLLVIAWAASERANPGEDQTGYPYIYGYWLNKDDTRKIDGYLQGENMLLKPTIADEWGLIYGIFPVPDNCNAIRFFMHQADGGQPQNGSAARFDEPGVFLFDTRKEAIQFMRNY